MASLYIYIYIYIDRERQREDACDFKLHFPYFFPSWMRHLILCVLL
jgi:hypothetical protein